MLNMKRLEWSDRFLSGYPPIDDYHKKIINMVTNVYEMLDSPLDFHDEIVNLTKELEKLMLDHMDIETDLLKKLNLPYKEHEASHEYYREKYAFYKDYEMNDMIRALLTSEISRDYMMQHFFEFDVKDMPLIQKNLEK